MTIGDMLKDYRKKNKMSQDKFVAKSGISKGYISMLENNTNSRNGKPIEPTLEMLRKLAFGMDIRLDELLLAVDGNQKISLRTEREEKKGKSDPLLQKILDCYNEMDRTGRENLAEQAEYLLGKHPRTKEKEA